MRRAQLVPKPFSERRIVTTSMTWRFAVQLDPQRPLNYSHEYSIVAMESEDYLKNQWTLSTGTSLDPAVAAEDPKSLQLRGATNADVPQEIFFETPFTEGWHNFEIVLHFMNEFVPPLLLPFSQLLQRSSVESKKSNVENTAQ